MSTSLDEFPAFFRQIGGNIIVVIDELLEADQGQQAGAKGEVSGQTKAQNGHGKINVETVWNDGQDVHVAHDLRQAKHQLSQISLEIEKLKSHLCVICLHHASLDDVAVHVNEAEEVETHRRRETTEEHAAEYKRILVRLVVRCQIVKI